MDRINQIQVKERVKGVLSIKAFQVSERFKR
jgi:hypothetical protein